MWEVFGWWMVVDGVASWWLEVAEATRLVVEGRVSHGARGGGRRRSKA